MTGVLGLIIFWLCIVDKIRLESPAVSDLTAKNAKKSRKERNN